MNGLLSTPCSVLEERQQRNSGYGAKFTPRKLLGNLRLRHLGKGRKHIDEVYRSVDNSARFGLQSRRPMDDARSTDSSLELILLVEAERCIASPRPSRRIGEGNLCTGRLHSQLGSLSIVGAGPIVRDKENHGVLQLAMSTKVFHDPANLLIDPINHCRQSHHPIGFVVALPSNDVLPAPDMGRTRARFQIFGEESQSLLPGNPSIPDLVPTGIVATLVFRIILRQRVKGGMRSVERNVEIEWLLGFSRFLEKLERVVDLGNRGVETRVRNRPGSTIESEGVVSLEEIAGATEVPIIAIETKIGRFLLQMPLPRHRREVAGFAKNLRRGDGMGQIDIPGRDTILSRQERNARGVTLCRVVELRETEPVSRKRIEGGSLDFTPIASDIGIAQIVDHDDDHIRSVTGEKNHRRKENEENSRKEELHHRNSLGGSPLRSHYAFEESNLGWLARTPGSRFGTAVRSATIRSGRRKPSDRWPSFQDIAHRPDPVHSLSQPC